MTALVVLAHGSPRPDANAAMLKVAEELRGRDGFGYVGVGFLECNEPSIPAALDAAAEAGATDVRIVPYFLHIGTHVAEDIPALLREAQARHPQVDFRLGEYLGLSPVLSEILAERALAR